MSLSLTGMLLLSVLIVGTTIGYFGFGAYDRMIQGEANAPTDPSEAWTASREFVRRNLKTPRTADFCRKTDPASYYQFRKDGAYQCGGWVDAQNAFGAMLRQNWAAVVSNEAHQWRLISLQIGDQVIVGEP